ncbi:polyprenol monophosphomannose synthase [Kribbella sp. NPDC050470]|uniref:polyprenol monophosphomannose synthase n=1 Tax=unclassified Kribbella TaxID=2644121 RepID=UPI0037B87E7C
MSTTPFADLGRILVIIPTYNEAENIEPIVSRLRDAVPEADVLVADDNSPDGTGELADKLAANDDHVHVLHRKGKEGLGAAYIAGFRWGIERSYGVLVEHDADGSHQPEQLPRLLTALRDADLVLGSRYVKGGEVQNWPKSREILSRGGNIYTRLALGVPLQDATGGYRAFRRATLEGIGLDEVASAGYCFQVDLAWRAIKSGFRVVEVPITFVERERGQSKMSRAIVVEAMARVGRWGVGHRARQLRSLFRKG